MIHLIQVDAKSELLALQKEARRRLMTGGAVFAIASDLTSEDYFCLFSRFSPHAKDNNIACTVLAELAKQPNLPSALLPMLAAHNEVVIQRALTTS